MNVSSIYKYAKISAFKAREVTRAIQGLPVAQALDIVAFSPKKAAGMVSKTLKSAIANAENNANLKVDGLIVKEATVGEGPTMKRLMTRARGSGSRILKRTSHIRIVVTDDVDDVSAKNGSKESKVEGAEKSTKEPKGRKTTKRTPRKAAAKRSTK